MRTQKPYVSKEQIEKARELDLLSYLERYEPQELVKVAPGVYSTRSHDSLKISHGKWFRWSRGYGGVSALDYLVKVKEMDFVSAVTLLCEKAGDLAPSPQPAAPMPSKTPFALPPANKNNDRVIAYLLQRGIHMGLIRHCINTGRLYEDTRRNCVFVGFDGQGTPKYAMLRSSDPNSAFLREAEGSDKAYAFSLPAQPDSNVLNVFESAIDTLSFCSLELMRPGAWKPDNYLALSGVYQPREKAEDTPLPLALSRFLHDNPQLAQINLCLDDDKAGRDAAQTIKTLLPGRYAVMYRPPAAGKDYNELLMLKKHLPMMIRTRGAERARTHEQEEPSR